MYGADRERLRGFFRTAWQKHGKGERLEPLEALVAGIVAEHPEYHALLLDPEAAARDFDGEATNPFLHLGLHIALAEQLESDRPPGIRALYRQVRARFDDRHRAEHRMMDCLQRVLEQAQRRGSAPDEDAYLACIRRLLAAPAQ